MMFICSLEVEFRFWEYLVIVMICVKFVMKFVWCCFILDVEKGKIKFKIYKLVVFVVLVFCVVIKVVLGLNIVLSCIFY